MLVSYYTKNMSYKKGFNFANIKEFCEKYKCKLLTKEDELDSATKMLKIISSCGHETNVTFAQLVQKKKGIYCNNCLSMIIDGTKICTCFLCDNNFTPTNVSFLFCSVKCSKTQTFTEKHKDILRNKALNRIDEYKDEHGNLKSIEEIN